MKPHNTFPACLALCALVAATLMAAPAPSIAPREPAKTAILSPSGHGAATNVAPKAREPQSGKRTLLPYDRSLPGPTNTPVVPAVSATKSVGAGMTEQQASKNYAVSARVFVTGNAARLKGNPGLSQLESGEAKLVSYLNYRDYRLIGTGRSLVTEDKTYAVPLEGDVVVAVMPMWEKNGKIRAQITWKEPNEEDWATQIFLRRDEPLMIGGPKMPGGGIYLLSLTIR